MSVAGAEKLVVGIVTGDASCLEVRQGLVVAAESAGASVESLSEATAISQAGAVDVLVFDPGIEAERLLPTLAALEDEPRTSAIPRIIVVDGDLPVSKLAMLGDGGVVFSVMAHDALTGAIARALSQVRTRNELVRLARSSTAAARDLEQALVKAQREGAALAHDVRVLIGVILGFAANLRDGFVGPISEQQREHLVSIVEATGDAGGLVDRYADALERAAPTPIDAAAVPRQPTRRHVDISALVRGTVAMFQGVASFKSIALATDAERATQAWCDPLQIKQALVNLVSNALKFTPAGGKVTVAARLGVPGSTRGAATERREVELVVSDTGPGIPESERERVFERGARLPRDQAVPGTGEGLAIVRDIAELHGGAVRAEDNPDGGLTMLFTIPTDRRTRSRELPAVTVPSTPPRSASGSPPSSRPHGPS